MQTEWIERKRDNLLRVELSPADGETPAVVREFAWGKDVPQKQAEAESLLIIESEA